MKVYAQRFVTAALLAGILAPGGVLALGDLQLRDLQSLLNEDEPPNPPASLVYPTLPLMLGEIDAETTAVTDNELLNVGSSPTILLLLDDPNMLIVDDDFAQCPNAQFTSIQAAVVAALPGSKIRVCPGLYNEQVLVNKTLTLEAPRHQGQASQCKAPFPPDPTQQAVVSYPQVGANPDIGFNVQANGVVIQGFTVQPAPPPAPAFPHGVGIFTGPAFSGHTIRHNVVQENTFGLYVNSNGAQETFVTHNCFRNNTQAGPASGNGIYSDQGLRNATIDNNYFTAHDNASVVVDNFINGVADLRITHNSIIDDSTIVIFNSSTTAFNNVLISYNHVVRPDGSAIFITGGVNNSEISFNRVEDGPSNGISVNNTFGPSPSQNLLVAKNHASGFNQSGIRLAGAAGPATNIQRNKSYSNVLDGLRAVSTALNYLIDQNHMKFNDEHDCHDDSGGPVNPQWTNNKGDTENKAGLCKGAATTP
jgi:hypothetical protein